MLQINFILVFLYPFNMLMIKKIKIKKYYFNVFLNKKTLTNNRYYTLKHPLKKLVDLMLIWHWFVLKAKPFLSAFDFKKIFDECLFYFKTRLFCAIGIKKT